MLTKEMYIEDIERFIYGCERNSYSNINTTIKKRIYGNYEINIEKLENNTSNYLTISKIKTNEKIINSKKILGQDFTNQELRITLEKIANECCFIFYDFNNVLDFFLNNEYGVIMPIFKKEKVEYDDKKSKFIYKETPIFLGFFTTLIECEKNFDFIIKLENEKYNGVSFEYFVLDKREIKSILKRYKETNNEWMAVLTGLSDLNCEISKKQTLTVNEILGINLIKFCKKNKLKLNEINTFNESIEDIVAKKIIENRIKKEKDKNILDITFSYHSLVEDPFLMKDIDEILKNNSINNKRMFFLKEELFFKILDIYESYTLNDIEKILKKYSCS